MRTTPRIPAGPDSDSPMPVSGEILEEEVKGQQQEDVPFTVNSPTVLTNGCFDLFQIKARGKSGTGIQQYFPQSITVPEPLPGR